MIIFMKSYYYYFIDLMQEKRINLLFIFSIMIQLFIIIIIINSSMPRPVGSWWIFFLNLTIGFKTVIIIGIILTYRQIINFWGFFTVTAIIIINEEEEISISEKKERYFD